MTTTRCARAALAALLCGLALAGCGGGGGDGAVQVTAAGYTVDSGVVQKGPLLRGSLVSVNELNPTTLQPAGGSYNFETSDDYGSFKPAATLFSSQYLETTALGYYFDELTGTTSTGMVMLRGLSDLGTDRAVNINLLTDLANARTRALATRATSPLRFPAARTQAQGEVLRAFYVHNGADLFSGSGTEPANFSELDLSKARPADLALAAFSAVVTQAGRTGGGISLLINRFEADLADDGILNNSLSPAATPAVSSQLASAAAAVDWAALAGHLNGFYRTTRYTAETLRQWVDTSGGADRVIDRHKSTALDAQPGVLRRSADYLAGSDDATQCLSATAGTLLRNGVAVVGSARPARGDRLAIELKVDTAGATASAFIQRSAPVSGACPTTVPASGTRLAKFTVGSLPVVSAVSFGALRYGQTALITVSGRNLDAPLTLASPGCTGMARSTSAPHVSTATTAYYTCSVVAVGAQTLNIRRNFDNTVLRSVGYTVALPQVTLTVNNGGSVAGQIVVTLRPDKTPITVNNFLAYVNSGFYGGTIFHRVVKDFVVQGGGFTGVAGSTLTAQTGLRAPIVLESNRGLSNLRGTIAMARTSTADSATSQFFFNTVNNTVLDYSSVSSPGYAVFGSIDAGIEWVDAMNLVATRTVGSNGNVPATDIVITQAVQTR
jgi:cyclophilin family peptidyl-prolyl cis-trans isomerase